MGQQLHNLSNKYTDWLTPDGLLLVEAWARDGLTNEQIASNMGIAQSTLYNWQKSYVEIMESLKRGKAVVDIQVENALLKRALGYRYVETTKQALFDSKGNPRFDSKGNQLLATTKKVTKEVVPDTTAQIFWLKNRKPVEWRDKPVENSDNIDRLNENLQDLAEILKTPVPNRELPDE